MTMMTTVIKIRKVEMVGSTSVKFTLICNRDDFDRVVILMMILGLTAAIRNLLRSFQQRLNQFDNEEAADIGYTLVPSEEMFLVIFWQSIHNCLEVVWLVLMSQKNGFDTNNYFVLSSCFQHDWLTLVDLNEAFLKDGEVKLPKPA